MTKPMELPGDLIWLKAVLLVKRRPISLSG